MNYIKDYISVEIVKRNIKLSIVSDMELEEPYLSIYNYLKNTYDNLKPYKSHKCSKYLYLFNNIHEIVFQIDLKVNTIEITDGKLNSNNLPMLSDDIEELSIWYISQIYDIDL